MIRASRAFSRIEAARAPGREVIFDCEHFFDGFKANKNYALQVAKTAHAAGARWVVLCDTNGGTLPHEIARIVAEVAEHVPGSHLGIHAHDDTGNAVANTLVGNGAGASTICSPGRLSMLMLKRSLPVSPLNGLRME